MPYHVKNLVVGCGQYLFKDDGFGPFVIKALEDYFKDKEMPEETMFIDAGNSAPFQLFSLPDEYWEKVIVVDVVQFNGEPGEVKLLSPYDMPAGMFECAHTYPVEEPLQQLVEDGFDVKIVGCKPGEITTPDVDVGLTDPVLDAIPKAVDMIFKELNYETTDKVTLKDFNI